MSDAYLIPVIYGSVRSEPQAAEFLDEFKWYVEALCVQREKGVPY